MWQPTNTQNNSSFPSWIFPDLASHNPQPNITIAQLSQAIMASWPLVNGIMKIPYSFSRALYWTEDLLADFSTWIYTGQYPLSVNAYEKNLVQAVIRAALNNWEKISNGTLQFYEASKFDLSGYGIFFNVIDVTTLNQLDAGADTIQWTDNNGYMRRADVFFPTTTGFWNTTLFNNTDLIAWAINAVHHEIGHTLGFLHLQDFPELNTTLQNTPDGVFCSVMPYPSVISTNISQCYTKCDPPYAIFPAALDKQLLRIAYKNRGNCRVSYYNSGQYIINIMNSMISSGGFSFFRQSVFAFALNLSCHPNKKMLSEKSSHLIADGVFIAADIAMVVLTNLPIWLAAISIASSATRYIPENFYDKLPLLKIAKTFLTSNYGLYIFNVIRAYLLGQCILLLLMTMCTSIIGTVIGILLGEVIGKLNAEITNKAIQGISVLFNICTHQNELQENPSSEVDIIISDPTIINEPTESDSLNTIPHNYGTTSGHTNRIWFNRRITFFSSTIPSFFNKACAWFIREPTEVSDIENQRAATPLC